MGDAPLPTITQASTDIVRALGELTNPPRDGRNPHFNSTFTTLPALLDHIRPVLAAYDLALLQEAAWGSMETPTGPVPLVGCRTWLIHGTGERWDAGTLLLLAGQTPQTAGSAMTYARRYAIQALLGIAGDDDDDGDSASRHGAGPTPPPAGTQPAPKQGGREDATAGSGGLAADPSAPTLPVGGGAVDWKKIALALTKAWKRNVTQTDAQQAVLGQLKAEDIAVKRPSDVNEDLAYHALQGLERKGRA